MSEDMCNWSPIIYKGISYVWGLEKVKKKTGYWTIMIQFVRGGIGKEWIRKDLIIIKRVQSMEVLNKEEIWETWHNWTYMIKPGVIGRNCGRRHVGRHVNRWSDQFEDSDQAWNLSDYNLFPKLNWKYV